MSAMAIRLNAALQGRYHIERELGAGGMATVYLAADPRHERRVALKVLKRELAAVVGAERFLAEIRTTANLQHPHILPLHDSGEADGFLFYVMPYVEGESLREKLDREHQLRVEEAVRIASDLAEALDHAHRHGVIHRDLKPANILLLDGRPVLADFGIALAVSAGGGGRLTETGLSLGTPHYMSPEQATGDQSVGPATDLYALGCVLYEMLVGEPPYTGSTPQAVLGRIITGEVPSARKHRTSVPVNVDAAISRALEKVPADRFASGEELARGLKDHAFRYGAQALATGRAEGRRAAPAGLTAVFAVLAIVALWGWLRPTASSPPGVATRSRLTGLDIGGGGGWGLAISPDGRWIAAVGAVELDGGGQGSVLYVRSAEDVEWRRLPGTGEASNPSFSPDGQSLAFDVSGSIMRVGVTGGPVLPIALGSSPHWGLDGNIVYSAGGSLYRVRATGGEPELLFGSDTIRVFRPHILPNERAVVFGTSAATDSRIVVLEVETSQVREVVPAGNDPRYVPTGHLIYGHADGVLMGVSFDPETVETSGSPVVLLPELSVYTGGASQFAVSEGGTLIYDVGSGGGSAGPRTLVEVSLQGVESPLPLSAAAMDGPRYSPAGDKIAYGDRSGGELRIYDVATGANPQFATGGYPAWSPSGDHLYFSATTPVSDVYRRPVDGREETRALWSRPGGEYVSDVGVGDSILVVRENHLTGGRNLLLVKQAADAPVFDDFLTAEWNETNGSISPDGRWIAYQSDETGDYRVYVHSFPVITGRHSVSPARGAEPVWSPDGRTLYYRDGSRFMAVEVTTEPDFSVSAPRALFDRPEYARYVNPGLQRNWDIHPDGSRFVMVKSAVQDGGVAPSSEVYIVTDWFEELRERMGVN